MFVLPTWAVDIPAAFFFLGAHLRRQRVQVKATIKSTSATSIAIFSFALIPASQET